MKRIQEKINMFLVIALLCCLSVGAVAEEMLMTIQAMCRAENFTADAVAQEDLELILESGVSTATHLGRQGWQFVAITDTEVLDSIANGAAAEPEIETDENSSIAEKVMERVEGIMETLADEPAINEAPAAIVIYADENAGSPNAGFDCGVAAQNMILTANALGYGTALVTAPLGALNGEEHDAWCMQFGIDFEMNAAAVLLLGVAEEYSQEEHNIEELMIEKVCYVQ